MERPLKEIKLPMSGYVAKVVTYFTRGELIEVAKASDKAFEAQDKALTIAVRELKSSDGEDLSGKIIETLNDLPVNDTKLIDDFLVEMAPKSKK